MQQFVERFPEYILGIRLRRFNGDEEGITTAVVELRCQLIVRPGLIDESEIPVDVNYNAGCTWVVIRRTPKMEWTVFCLDAEELSPRLGACDIYALLGGNAQHSGSTGRLRTRVPTG